MTGTVLDTGAPGYSVTKITKHKMILSLRRTRTNGSHRCGANENDRPQSNDFHRAGTSLGRKVCPKRFNIYTESAYIGHSLVLTAVTLVFLPTKCQHTMS